MSGCILFSLILFCVISLPNIIVYLIFKDKMKWYKYWTLMPVFFAVVSVLYTVIIFQTGDCYCTIAGQEYETFFAYAFYSPYFSFIYFVGFVFGAAYWICLAFLKLIPNGYKKLL